MSLTNFEKKLLQGANPDLVEYIQSKFQSAVASCEALMDLVNQEHYDAAKQMTDRVTLGMATFHNILDEMKYFAEHGKEPGADKQQLTLPVGSDTPEPAPVEPAPVTAPAEGATVPEGSGELV